jgi:hypothetical protein
MSTAAPPPVRRAVVPLLRIVLAAQAVRLVVAVVAGIAASTQHAPGADFGPGPLESGAQRLTDFADAGDGFGVLFMLLAVLLLWATASVATLPEQRRAWRTDRVVTSWLLVLTALSSVLLAIGYAWAATGADFFPVAQEVRLVGSAGIWAVVLAAVVYVTRGMTVSPPVADPGDAADPDDAPAAVFAVDRATGDVLAWPSRADARDKAPLYGVEDDEFEWFLDDGTVLLATAQGRDVAFTSAGDERPDDLLRHLKDYATRRGLVADDDDEDEPLAYVEPIAREHHLAMWPGWLRWLGRLTR